jgi:error-prone DNA polymerase
MGFYPPEVIVGDARRHEVELLPPDINRSRRRCAVEGLPAEEKGEAVRTGLAYVQGVGEKGGRAIEEARDRGGPQTQTRVAGGLFRSLRDFCWRTGLRREAVENLIRASAFDEFGLNRRELLWQLGLVYNPDGRNSPQRQIPLPLPTEQDEVPLRDLTRWERLVADYETLGFSLCDHPMATIRNLLGEGIVSTAHVETLPDGVEVQVAGMVVCRQQPCTAKGFVFLVLEDESGLANVVVKPAVYLRCRALVRAEPFVIVSGRLQRRDGVTNVIATSFRPLRVPRELIAPEAHNFG